MLSSDPTQRTSRTPLLNPTSPGREQEVRGTQGDGSQAGRQLAVSPARIRGSSPRGGAPGATRQPWREAPGHEHGARASSSEQAPGSWPPRASARGRQRILLAAIASGGASGPTTTTTCRGATASRSRRHAPTQSAGTARGTHRNGPRPESARNGGAHRRPQGRTEHRGGLGDAHLRLATATGARRRGHFEVAEATRQGSPRGAAPGSRKPSVQHALRSEQERGGRARPCDPLVGRAKSPAAVHCESRAASPARSTSVDRRGRAARRLIGPARATTRTRPGKRATLREE